MVSHCSEDSVQWTTTTLILLLSLSLLPSLQISVHLGIPDVLVDPKIWYEPQKAEVDIRVQCIREEVPHQRALELRSRWILHRLGTMLDDNNDILIVNLEKEPVWNRIRNCTNIGGMEPTEPNHEGDAERFGKWSRKKNKKRRISKVIKIKKSESEKKQFKWLWVVYLEGSARVRGREKLNSWIWT